MTPDTTTASLIEILTDPIKLLVAVMAVIGGLATIAKLIATVRPWLASWLASRSVRKRLGATLYTPADIHRATRYYVQPMSQNLDPAHFSEPGKEGATREDLFAAMDRLLNEKSEYKYIVLLADSGMGKSAFVLNYYARHLKRRKKYKLELLPLGIKDADDRIAAIENKHEKVLFLDALDEDVLAIVDHAQRVRELCDMAQEFQKVLITCRTQFFPRASEEPGRTGVLRLGDVAGGQKSEYTFHKLYLSPFDDRQVEAFLRKRYPLLQRGKRKQARELVAKVPNLTARPMLLSYIDDLLDGNQKYDYSYLIYEKMVDAWLEREEGKVEGLEKEPLLKFCERLAIEIYIQREKHKGERMPISEIEQVAKQADFDVELETWKLTGRSLLNRDAEDRFKFAHRSIMEYLFVKRFLELPVEMRPKTKFTDQMIAFLFDMAKKKSALRSHGQTLSDEQVKQMLQEKSFFDSTKNKTGIGVEHQYFKIEQKGCKLIFDLATGLTWQQSGSPKTLTFSEAEKYIRQLNKEKFAGYNDWRLPTLEEAMSLMEREKKRDDLYIDTVFDKTQRWIWTADKYSAESAWVVIFVNGNCDHASHVHDVFVRAVRS